MKLASEFVAGAIAERAGLKLEAALTLNLLLGWDRDWVERREEDAKQLVRVERNA